MKKLIDLKDNALNINEMSLFNGGKVGDTGGGIHPREGSYSCDYNQPDDNGTLYYLDGQSEFGID